ncbi:MAG: peptidoglycan DD-metalloendopeptidase family protein [candidate division WOR-3 bacterium]
MKSLTFLFFSFWLITAFSQEVEEFEKKKRELEETKRKLAEIEGKIKTLEKEEKSVLKRIEAVDEKISVTRKYLQQLSSLINLKEKEIAGVKREIVLTQRKIKQSKENLSQLLFLFYKINRFLPLEFYLEGKSLPAIYRKVINLKYLGREGKRSIEELSQLKKELEVKEKKLLTAHQELAKMKQEKVAEENSLKGTKELEKKILSRVRMEKEKQARMEKDLKEAKARLEKIIAELEKRRQARRLAPGAHYLEIMKGNLPWPVKGRVVSYFGSQLHPKYKTRTKNTGIDIECAVGSPVKVIAKGRVVYAERFMGYGNMVIVDHREGYYTIYSDLSEILVTVGQELEGGNVLGKASENLHFEIRREGKPVDPLEWLGK